VKDQSADQGVGFLVPVRLADLLRRIMHQSVGDQRGVLGDIDACGIETRQWVETCAGESRHLERVQHIDGAEAEAGAVGDAGVLALGVDAEHRARRHEQVGDHRAHALARARGRDGQDVRRPS
jgi:hypothetical protein